MHLSNSKLNFILNVFLGIAWAISIYSLIYGFFSNISVSIFAALLSAILHFVAGLFLVVIVEMIFIYFKNYEEQKESRELIKKFMERENS